MRFKAKQKKVLLFIVAISIILFTFFNWQNNSIIITKSTYQTLYLFVFYRSQWQKDDHVDRRMIMGYDQSHH